MTRRKPPEARAAKEPALGNGRGARPEALVQSYRRLAEVFHDVLSEQNPDSLLERIADTLAELVPYGALHIYEADEAHRQLVPVLVRSQWANEILNNRPSFGEGITGWAVEHRQPVLSNRAHLDPRVKLVPGTPSEPEALIALPLIARGSLKGTLNIYRIGEEAAFSEEEFELAKWFGAAAALALDNAQVRARLEHLAQTDPLTGLYNHRHFHERLRAELMRVSRTHDSVALLMLDIDQFKKVNDVHGHAAGDQILVALAETVRATVRGSDVVCRIGGEELAIILPSCDAGDALGLSGRLAEKLASVEFEPAGKITVSIGISQGPEHAMNPRELVACAEAAMMTAKARGGDRVVLFDEEATRERPDGASSSQRDVRSIAHLKMLQSLAGKLNRLNDVRQIGTAIANELRLLIDYHNCRVYAVEGEDLIPIAFHGELAAYREESVEHLAAKVGEGITGRVAQTGRSLLVPNGLECEFAVQVPGTHKIEESIVAVPLCYGTRVNGVIVISKLGIDQFDGDDVRLLEVLAGHASVALENARLYEEQRREAERAKALLEFADAMSKAPSFDAVGQETVRTAARLFEASQSALWLESERPGELACVAHFGYADGPETEALLAARIDGETAERLLGTGKTAFVLTPEERRRWLPATPEISCPVAIAPLQGEGLRGWITVRQPESTQLTEERLQLLVGLSYQASVALQKARLYREQKESAEIANALLEFSRELAAAEGLVEVLGRIVELSAKTLGSPRTSVWLQHPETGEVRAEAVWGYSEPERERILARRYEAVETHAFVGATEPFLIGPEDYEALRDEPDRAEDVVFAVAPLGLDGGRLGAIVASVPDGGDELGERKMRLLAGLAHQAKLAIASAGNYEGLERTFLSTIEALANALEANDEYTSSHTRWITDMALRVGAELGLDGRSLKRLELGALFHDIGKIGIPSEILSKPGRLSPEERALIEQHPELGERILAPIERLAEVRPIVRACHEHYDGRGYPGGKADEEIPIEARIILVCDAFHAMITDRPYRKRLSLEQASERLQEAAGTQFDPKVVEVFLRLLESDGDVAAVPS